MVEPHLAQFGEEAVSPQVFAWNSDAEANLPYVKKYNVWGQRYGYDKLITADGWKQLGKWGAKHGLVVRLVLDMHLTLIPNVLGLFRWDTTTHTAFIGALFNMLRMLQFLVLFHEREY